MLKAEDKEKACEKLNVPLYVVGYGQEGVERGRVEQTYLLASGKNFRCI